MSFFIQIKPSKAGAKEFGHDELIQLNEYLLRQGYSLSQIEEDELLQQEVSKRAADFVMQQGMTACLKQDLVCDSVLPVSNDVPVLVSIIQCHLAQLKASKELLVIDPYFFPDKVEVKEYLSMLESMFHDAVVNIEVFKVIAKSEVNITLKNQFFDRLKSINSKLKMELIESNTFHDRFIIADGKRGAFIGTSLNGIGRKYALIDYMRDDDAQEIYAAYQQDV